MFIIIRVDSSYHLGTGHVMRCLTLAKELSRRGATIEFICRAYVGNLISLITNQGYPVHRLANDLNDQLVDAAETIKILKTLSRQKVDWLIVDHYTLNEDWEKKLRSYVKKIMVIDDLANRKHQCDVLLDQTFGRQKNDYLFLVPQCDHLLLGAKYALLRDEFSRLRSQALTRHQQQSLPKKVLVTFGGTDPINATGWVIEVVKEKNLGLQFDIIVGPHMKFYQELKQKNNPDFIRIHDQVENIADYMLQADLAIGAGGITSWERCCLGLATLLIITANNQKKVAYGLAEAGAVKLLGKMEALSADDLIKVLQQCIQQPDRVSKMSMRAAPICDGYGVKRVTNILFPVCARDGKPIYLRPASMEDAPLMLTWQQHPTTRQFARNPQPPTVAEHDQWLTKRLADNDCLFHIIVHGNVPVGVLRLDRLKELENAYEISILTSPNCRHEGIGSSALRIIRDMFPEFNLHAAVLENNQISHALFIKAGYEIYDSVYINKAKMIN